MASARKLLILWLLLLALGGASWSAEANPVHARHAMVASQNGLASQVGVDIMQQGGNAVDAAVATGFALAVVHPQAGNLGGGGFMLLRTHDGVIHFLDFRETAPATAGEKMYLDAQGNVIANASVVGYKAIAVPGSVAGLAYAQKKWGKLALAQVMAPAIRLAQSGFPLSYLGAEALRDPKLTNYPESKRIFQSNPERHGDFYQQGDILRQPELARTLQQIAKDPASFYTGSMARELVAAMQAGGGLITATDLARYQVKERSVVRGSYRGYEIISSPPPSSGGIVLLEALNILEAVPLSGMGNRSAESMHWVAEAFRRAYLDRAEFLGDPDFVSVPVAQLLDKKYAAAWRESISDAHATPSAGLKRPSGFGELDREASMPRRESANTTHYSVVDKDGNAVAVTTTLNDSFGSRVTAKGLGFLLNDEMDDFSAKPGAPNLYGLVQGPANAIAAGKRPLSSLAPTIVLKDGKLFMVLGSPGGSKIITTVANILMGVVDFGMNIQEAVNAPRFHHQWEPDSIMLENEGFSPDTIQLLQSRGHKLTYGTAWSDGECIMIDPKTGELLGASDPRHDGKAVGY